ncbi:MAG TPA: ERF family protein [Pyrinomonadaceae bacterium]|nr:ERF family protein [Pyrinomonadaceae bacterium]
MNKSENICDLAKALMVVQASLAPAKRDSTNPYYNSTYADLSSVWESCRVLLSKNGLCVIQGNRVGAESTLIVETFLIHESGQWVQSELCLPLSKNDPQGVGSAMTYGRRYGLAAIIGIVADADDDGNAASAKNSNGNVRAIVQNGRPIATNQPIRNSVNIR